MATQVSFEMAAQEYAEGVRALFAPAVATRGAAERSITRALRTSPTLSEDAQSLLAKSAQLNAAGEQKLATGRGAARGDSEMQLLAKAMVDLDVGLTLLQVAQTSKSTRDATAIPEDERERSASDANRDIEDNLTILLGAMPMTMRATIERSGQSPLTVDEAKEVLLNSVSDALAQIPTRAHATGNKALDGIVTMGLMKVLSSAGAVVQDVAGLLGQGEALNNLIALARGFFEKFYQAILTAIGESVLKAALEQAQDYFKDLAKKKDEFASKYLEKLYETQQTKKALQKLVSDSTTDAAKLSLVAADVEALSLQFLNQMGLVEKILGKLSWIKPLVNTLGNAGTTSLAAFYLIVIGYVVVVAGDYVDAPKLKIFDRMRGVNAVVAAGL